jgi:hypothetical protein
MTNQIKGSAMNRLLIASPIVDGRATSRNLLILPFPRLPPRGRDRRRPTPLIGVETGREINTGEFRSA